MQQVDENEYWQAGDAMDAVLEREKQNETTRRNYNNPINKIILIVGIR